MNASRLIASVGSYFYATKDDVIAVHLYGANSAKLSVGKRTVKVRQITDYPWQGHVRLTIDPEAPMTFTLRLRIPDWVRSETVKVNGTVVCSPKTEKGYAVLEREWKGGDKIELDLPMPVERVYAHPNVKADVGRVCLKRGPLVYCAEDADNPSSAILRLRLPQEVEISTVKRAELFDGIVSLAAEARLVETDDWNGSLYRMAPPATAVTRMVAIPYYIWNNRGPGRMVAWIPEYIFLEPS
jgi:uncharacterized protein